MNVSPFSLLVLGCERALARDRIDQCHDYLGTKATNQVAFANLYSPQWIIIMR